MERFCGGKGRETCDFWFLLFFDFGFREIVEV